LFFICKVFGFCKVLWVVKCCARVVILQLSQHFQAIDAPLSSCFFKTSSYGFVKHRKGGEVFEQREQVSVFKC
jgi:hypothetical protein